MPTTKITLELSEEVSRRASERAAQEGTTISDIVRQKLEEYAIQEKSSLKSQRRSLRLSEFDRNWQPTVAEFEESLATLAKMSKLAQEIGHRYPDLKVDAVELIREERRF
ncbi:MAG: hypothetical protein WCS37_17130 [Chloroflexota bacterium]|nr:hypothetical protein [Chloroflexota bacterium]